MFVRRGCTDVLIWLLKIVSIDAGRVSSYSGLAPSAPEFRIAHCLGGRHEELFQANSKASRANFGSRGLASSLPKARVERQLEK